MLSYGGNKTWCLIKAQAMKLQGIVTVMNIQETSFFSSFIKQKLTLKFSSIWKYVSCSVTKTAQFTLQETFNVHFTSNSTRRDRNRLAK